jgi:hypothetical protein
VPNRCALPLLLVALAATGWAHAQPAPVFIEAFTAPRLTDRWIISPALDPLVHALRVSTAADPIGRQVGRFTVEQGDALSGASETMRRARRYVCGADGSRAAEMRFEGGAPSERAEMQIRHDRATGTGELVRFDAPVWYRFAFKIPADWPRDMPANGRSACRTVIHQVKQDAFKDGTSCSASPFFKIEARPLGDHALFFAQIASGGACAMPPTVERTRICVTEAVPRDAWTEVNVHLRPAVDASGRADVWLNGRHCGSYQGPMGDARDGARRDGKPVANAQPRFGIYRDWRAESQTIYFDRIMFWDADPAGHPDWNVTQPPSAVRMPR